MNFIKNLKKHLITTGIYRYMGHQKPVSRDASTEYTSEFIPEKHEEIKKNLDEIETIVEKVRKLGGF